MLFSSRKRSARRAVEHEHGAVCTDHAEGADRIAVVDPVEPGGERLIPHIHAYGSYIGTEIIQALYHGDNLFCRLLDHRLVNAGKIGLVGILGP